MTETMHAWNAVVVIQSLEAGKDRATGYELSNCLQDCKRLFRHRATIRYEEVEEAEGLRRILLGLAEEAQLNGLRPILHLETHGWENGIVLSSGEQIAWSDLRAPLTELNRATDFNLLVTNASCFGNRMLTLLFDYRAPSPCFGLIGPTGKVQAGTIESGFQAFYRVLLETNDPRGAMVALDEQRRDDDAPFVFFSAGFAFRYAFVLRFLAEECPAADQSDLWAVFEEIRGRPTDPDERPRGRVATMARSRYPEIDAAVEVWRRRFFMVDTVAANESRFQLSVDALLNVDAVERMLPG